MTHLGEITLNVSLVLYLILYLPQLWHNRFADRVRQMSMAFHGCLCIAAICDLFYAFGRIEQWQYRLVSVFFLSCLVFQHFQLGFGLRCWYKNISYVLISFLLFSALMVFFPLLHLLRPMPWVFIALGWGERVFYWLYSVPQIIKNHKDEVALAISPYFVVIALMISVLDGASAWLLHWGSPSLYGAPMAIMIHLLLLFQIWGQSCIKNSCKDAFGISSYSLPV